MNKREIKAHNTDQEIAVLANKIQLHACLFIDCYFINSSVEQRRVRTGPITMICSCGH